MTVTCDLSLRKQLAKDESENSCFYYINLNSNQINEIYILMLKTIVTFLVFGIWIEKDIFLSIIVSLLKYEFIDDIIKKRRWKRNMDRIFSRFKYFGFSWQRA